MRYKKGSKVFVMTTKKPTPGIIKNVFKGNYYKGKKRIGLRTFYEVRAKGKEYILQNSELKPKKTIFKK